MITQTQDESAVQHRVADVPVPGVVIVYSAGVCMLRTVPLGDGALTLGREDAGGLALPDERISRAHLRLSWDGRRWTLRDLGSRNGSFLDGVRLQPEGTSPTGGVVRIGQTLMVLCSDLRRFIAGVVTTEGDRVVGPTLKAALDTIAAASCSGECVLITGETGTGKELAARVFHQAAGGGPFVPVNCAAVPSGLAERLLFGAQKGAYSDARADAEGYVQAADGGVLFLDEVGELDLQVQAKLLRVLETREVLTLGSSTARKVTVQFCAATHRDLRGAVADGRFRADFYYRIGQPEVQLPALRERFEEIPWLVALALQRAEVGLSPHVTLVEECLTRPWPGNVRELLSEVRRAAMTARAQVGASSVRAEHLPATAGMGMKADHEASPAASPLAGPAGPAGPAATGQPTRENLLQALDAQGGSVAGAARLVGLHRTQVYRLMKRYGIGGSAD